MLMYIYILTLPSDHYTNGIKQRNKERLDKGQNKDRTLGISGMVVLSISLQQRSAMPLDRVLLVYVP